MKDIKTQLEALNISFPNEPSQTEKKEAESYVGSPYNFVPFNQKVFEYKEEIPPYNTYSSSLLSGEIVYSVEAKTPLSIGDNKKGFYKNSSGQYSIMGSTIRGLVRTNAKILSYGSFYEEIDNYPLMYREVASGRDKDKYNNILGNKLLTLSSDEKKITINILKNVKAGYLVNKNGDFSIRPTVKDSSPDKTTGMNYYVISERQIIENKLSDESDNSFSYILSKLQHKCESFRQEIKKNKKGKKEVHYIGTQNSSFHPFFEEISYKIKGTRKVIAIKEKGFLENQGYILISGQMQEKKAVYVIPEMDETADSILLEEKDILAFKRDLKRKETNIKKDLAFFSLPEDGEKKPVFYIRLDGKIYFGFTPRLRLFYPYEICHGLPDVHKKEVIDYCDAIFGYTKKNDARKSRVSFLDAAFIKGDKTEITQQRVLLGPKPSSYMDYIFNKKFNEKENIHTYNNIDFKLRGIKQYWLKKQIIEKEKTADKQEEENNKIISSFNTLKAGCVFKGVIKFHNLTKQELGLLLYALELEKNSYQNIGKGKPYGFGMVKISVTELNLWNDEKAYQLEHFCFHPYQPSNEKIEEYKNAFFEEMKQFLPKDLKEKGLKESERIKQFLKMKSCLLPPQYTRYMKLEEYRNRKVLPSILDVIKHAEESKKNNPSSL